MSVLKLRCELVVVMIVTMILKDVAIVFYDPERQPTRHLVSNTQRCFWNESYTIVSSHLLCETLFACPKVPR